MMQGDNVLWPKKGHYADQNVGSKSSQARRWHLRKALSGLCWYVELEHVLCAYLAVTVICKCLNHVIIPESSPFDTSAQVDNRRFDFGGARLS